MCLSKNGSLTPQQIAEIKSKITISDLTGALRSVMLAAKKDFSLTAEINVMQGFDGEKIKEEVERRLKNIALSARIGECIFLGVMTKSIMSIDGIADFGIYSPDSIGNEIYCGGSEILHLKELIVRCFYD